ncbi:hypothetical protein CRENBAI_017228 [Crenichthys baileyi]|uniref:Uncharacterized protein n=1 Tax=Crenichthys baileyi TaxID=28760 RepID=A0AAV9QX18_9TELE
MPSLVTNRRFGLHVSVRFNEQQTSDSLVGASVGRASKTSCFQPSLRPAGNYSCPFLLPRKSLFHSELSGYKTSCFYFGDLSLTAINKKEFRIPGQGQGQSKVLFLHIALT